MALSLVSVPLCPVFPCRAFEGLSSWLALCARPGGWVLSVVRTIIGAVVVLWRLARLGRPGLSGVCSLGVTPGRCREWTLGPLDFLAGFGFEGIWCRSPLPSLKQAGDFHNKMTVSFWVKIPFSCFM